MSSTTHFFLGANSGRGFQNLFDRFCTPEDHYDLLVLKGGPGAGKSTMMRRIGQAMEEHGEDVEYLYCSGDPKSLDGVHIPRIKTAVVDGTAPHGTVSKGHFHKGQAISLPEEAPICYDAITAAVAKANDYHCREPYYIKN